MFRYALVLLLPLFALHSATADDKEPTGPNDPQLRALCMKFVTVTLIEPNPEEVAKLFDKDCQSKRGLGGKHLVEEVQRKKEEFVKKIRVMGVQFFTADSLAETQQQHPRLKFLTGDRVPAHLEGGLGCLFSFRHVDQGRLYTSVVVVKKVGEKALITYIDDEP